VTPPAPFALSLSKPVLSACLGRQSKGAALLLRPRKKEGQGFDKLSPNGGARLDQAFAIVLLSITKR